MKSPSSFIAITSEGGLLPADFLHELPDPTTKIEGVTPVGYHLAEGERLNEQINRSWHRLKGCWGNFKTAVAGKQAGEPTTTETRDRWLYPLFQELGFGRVTPAKPIEADGRSYPVSHSWNQLPIHLVGSHADLDRRTPGAVGAAKASPHSLVQSALNASDDHLWGIVSNGFNLRLLRDNIALTRLAFVEFDLQAMFDGDLYSEFFVLWLVCHQSRFESEKPALCWLERWKKIAEEKTLRALDDLYPGVKKAIAALGTGLISNRANGALLEKLRTGRLSTQEFYKQVLRVIYRMLFLLVAEDRALLHLPDDTEAALKARRRYLNFYSIARLRGLSRHRAGTPHPDIWHVFQFVTAKLGSDSCCPELALPPLGSFLWTAAQSTPDLFDSLISNRHFLEAVHALAFVQDGNVRRAVDYKNLGSEELGSVYQGLLEMHPRINTDTGSFELDIAAGNERKTSGSYYTPDSLVQCLLDSALEPVIAERLAKAKTPKEKETVLLGLKACDMATGSGHFLLRAAHRIARHLARVRSGEDEPSPAVYRTALRDVIGHCLYGVDINPMAVELCKVTLWLEALEPGKPLSFLDHHIRCGNSLLGATPELISAGLPDDAFEAIEGDDKTACSSLKKLNRAEREGLRHLFVKEDNDIREMMRKAAVAIDEMSDSRPEDIRRKESAFRAAQSNYNFGKAWDLANLWCAAFVIKKHFPSGASDISNLQSQVATLPVPATTQPGLFGGTDETPKPKAKKTKLTSRASSETPIGVTTQHLRDFVEGGALPDGLLAETKRLASQYQFFHYHLAFPEVFAQDGFDVSLGNPPWERVKLQQKEWFTERRPEIANAPNAAARKRLMEDLNASEPGFYQLFLADSRKAEGESHLIRHSGLFPLCGCGDVNTFAVFAELSRKLTNTKGYMACVLPLGIVTDDTTKEFFSDLVKKTSLVSVLGFINEQMLFAQVLHNFKFCILVATGGSYALPARFSFNCYNVEETKDPERWFNLTPQQILQLNPETGTCPTFFFRRSAELTLALYRRFPILASAETGWNIELSAMLHMGEASKLFSTSSQPGYKPVYESKMIHQFNHRFASYHLLSEGERSHMLPETPEELFADPDFSPSPCYYCPESEIAARLNGKSARKWIIASRRITSAGLYRTCIYAIVPLVGASDSMTLAFISNASPALQTVFVAIANSFAFDFVTRQKQAGANLSFFVKRQLPIIPADTFAKQTPWDSSLILETWIFQRAFELTYTAWDLEAFAMDCGWSGPPFRWDEERRFLLRCELDAAFFHLYLGGETEWRQQPIALTKSFPTPRAAVSYILDTFPIVKRRDEEKFNGDYRTRRVILEIYDAIQQSMATGQSYQTLLNPPPADPRCCHPSKQIVIPPATWMDRPLVQPSTRRVGLAPNRYRATVVPHLLYQAGGSMPFERFRKAYWLLTEPKTLERYATGAVGAIAHKWSREFRDTLQKDMFIEHLKGAVGRQLHFVRKGNERWLELRDPKVADEEHVIFDARLALLVADLWPEAEAIAPLAAADETAIQQLEVVL